MSKGRLGASHVLFLVHQEQQVSDKRSQRSVIIFKNILAKTLNIIFVADTQDIQACLKKFVNNFYYHTFLRCIGNNKNLGSRQASQTFLNWPKTSWGLWLFTDVLGLRLSHCSYNDSKQHQQPKHTLGQTWSFWDFFDTLFQKLTHNSNVCKKQKLEKVLGKK